MAGSMTFCRSFNVFGRNHARTVAPVDGESVAVVERLSRGEIFLDSRPHLNLAGIREQHAHDGALFGGLFDGEQGLARHPSVGDCLFIGLAFALSDESSAVCSFSLHLLVFVCIPFPYCFSMTLGTAFLEKVC